MVVCDGVKVLLPVGYSPTPTTDRLPVSGVGDEDTVDIIRHCSFTTGSATTTSCLLPTKEATGFNENQSAIQMHRFIS